MENDYVRTRSTKSELNPIVRCLALLDACTFSSLRIVVDLVRVRLGLVDTRGFIQEAYLDTLIGQCFKIPSDILAILQKDFMHAYSFNINYLQIDPFIWESTACKWP